MKTLPASVILEKNKLTSPNPFLVLLDVELSPTEKIYLVRNTEDFTFSGQVYTAFAFDLDVAKECSKGDIPILTLRVANAARALEPYLEAYDGLAGNQIILRVVNAANPADVALQMYYKIIFVNADALWVNFSLGAPSPLRLRFPQYRYIASHCGWPPGGAECALPAAYGVCKRTYDDCVAYANTRRFGGDRGMSSISVRLA
jgi:phage-related protein